MSTLLTEVALGNVRARCPQCRSTRFVPADPGEDLTHLSDLICAHCESPVTHGELIMQIADEALREARDRLAARSKPEARLTSR
jgi:hypothetical protein